MEITCPNCQNTFEAATRRAICQHCSTTLDVWALLGGQTSSVQQPGEAQQRVSSAEGLSYRARSTSAEGSSNRNDPYATSFAPSSDSVLDLPPREPILAVPELETDHVLEESFSALPKEFVQPAADEAVVAAPEAAEEEEGAPDKPRPWRRAAGWIVAALLIIGVVVPLIYFLRDAARPLDVPGTAVTTLGTSTATTSSSPLVPVTSPAVATTSPAAQAAEATSEGTSRRPTPSPAAETRPGTENLTQPGQSAVGESATRARAVNPETLSVGRYTLQVGAHPTEEEAKQMAERLIDAGLDARIMRVTPSGLDPFYRVRVGAFATKEEAAAYGEQLKRAGRVDGFFVTDRRR